MQVNKLLGSHGQKLEMGAASAGNQEARHGSALRALVWTGLHFPPLLRPAPTPAAPRTALLSTLSAPS